MILVKYYVMASPDALTLSEHTRLENKRRPLFHSQWDMKNQHIGNQASGDSRNMVYEGNAEKIKIRQSFKKHMKTTND